MDSQLLCSCLPFNAASATQNKPPQHEKDMKNTICQYIAFALTLPFFMSVASAESVEINSYGKYQQMIHMKNSDGVVELREAISGENVFAVGAIQHGLGEITVVDGRPYLDYGDDGIGNSKNTIPKAEQAVLLVTATVSEWQSIKIPGFLPQEKLFEVILSKAKEYGLDAEKPFPFLLEGGFKELKVHVINGRNPKFMGHGSKEKFYKMAVATTTHLPATVVGFYSANNQGVYTHPGESWHLHAVIEENKASVHVDEIHTGGHVTLKFPTVEKHDKRIGLVMSDADKAEFLSEMRQMLASIQGIMAGIGTEDRELIFKSAKYSGNRMARATPDSVRKMLPQSFKDIGGPTHMMFEELAIRSETDDMDMLAEFTGELMKQCLACHAAFKVE